MAAGWGRHSEAVRVDLWILAMPPPAKTNEMARST
jgi:hypothetical protein